MYNFITGSLCGKRTVRVYMFDEVEVQCYFSFIVSSLCTSIIVKTTARQLKCNFILFYLKHKEVRLIVDIGEAIYDNISSVRWKNYFKKHKHLVIFEKVATRSG